MSKVPRPDFGTTGRNYSKTDAQFDKLSDLIALTVTGLAPAASCSRSVF